MKYKAHASIHKYVHGYTVSPCSLIPSYPHRNRAGDEHDVRLALRAPAAFPPFLALLFSVHVPAPAALGSTNDCPVLSPQPSAWLVNSCHHFPHSRPAPVTGPGSSMSFSQTPVSCSSTPTTDIV